MMRKCQGNEGKGMVDVDVGSKTQASSVKAASHVASFRRRRLRAVRAPKVVPSHHHRPCPGIFFCREPQPQLPVQRSQWRAYPL